MDNRQRKKLSLGGTVAVHFLVFLMISFTGILNMNRIAADDIVEVMLAGGGGGGGSGSEIEAAAEKAAAPEETTQADEIVETGKKDAPAPKPAVEKAAAHKSTGQGTGVGSGKGSGIGLGSGSGSGGGHGSGHGTGTGSGSGPGSGIYSSPAIPPRIVRNPAPIYPAAERNARIEGTARLRLLVGKDGKVEEVTVLASSGNSNLDSSAIKACYKWRFTSARNQSGQNVRCYLTIPITFRLRN